MAKQIKSSLLLLLILISVGVVAQNQHPSIGGYNVYYGDLHNHSIASDGKTPPDSMYILSRTRNKMDFFALTDHSFPWKSYWRPILDSIANVYNDEGSFCALLGFEWTNNIYGHINVFCSDTVLYLNPNHSENTTFCEFTEWLSTQDRAIAFFNHPGYVEQHYELLTEFNRFDSCNSSQIIGIELFNCAWWFDNTYGYYRATATDSLSNYFAEANQKGWRIGPMGNGDAHKYPTSSSERTVILADSLTRDDLFSALRKRRYYMTDDTTLLLSYKIGGFEMGSIVTPGNYNLKIEVENKTQIQDIYLFNQDLDTVLHESYPSSVLSAVVETNLNCTTGNYFNVKVNSKKSTYRSHKTYSSPIWVDNCDVSNPYEIINETISSVDSVLSCSIFMQDVVFDSLANYIAEANSSILLSTGVKIESGSVFEGKIVSLEH